jgi:DNA repair exonuclease SbcCD ATPase subunit
MKMDSMMNMVMSVFSPMVFWPIIGVISIAFVFVVIFSFFSDKKNKDQDFGNQKKILELEQALSQKDAQLKALDDKSQAREADYSRQLTRLEEQISENEASKTRIKTLEIQLKEKENLTSKADNLQQEFNKKLQGLQAEIDKAKKETLLKDQMYNGLKTQYDELENQQSSQAKQYADESQKTKKLQQELDEAKKKLEQALKDLNAAKASKASVAVQAPAPKKEEPKPEAVPDKKEPVQALEKKEEPPASIVFKPHLPAPEVKPEATKKPKPPSSPSSKVRLAAVMQEAAKVAAKRDEKDKPPVEDKNKPPEQKSEPGSQQPNTPKPAGPPTPGTA